MARWGCFSGALVSSELAGFFLIIMVSLMDTTLQAPVENPLANKDFLAAFPTYGPMQVAVSGGFGHGVQLGSVLLALALVRRLDTVGSGNLLVAHTRLCDTLSPTHRSGRLDDSGDALARAQPSSYNTKHERRSPREPALRASLSM